jgi:hypothetical protein
MKTPGEIEGIRRLEECGVVKEEEGEGASSRKMKAMKNWICSFALKAVYPFWR